MLVKKSSLISYVLGLVAVLFMSTGCGDNWIPEGELPDPGTSSKEITKFTVNGVDGTIAGTNIAVVVPFGTDVTALSPQIVHTGASINPASGAAQSFTSPVSYTVTAIDGTTQSYQATVSVAASDAKDITRFTILGVDGVINGTSITLTLPFASAISNLTPTIVHTGVSINPPSGVGANFTSPVDYLVRAADGSTKKYTVTVMAATSNSKDITKFTILGVDGAINGTNITLTLPFGTSLLNLTPTIMHTGISVSPASGSAQSFLAPVLYTVSAVDFSTKVYTVTVNVAPSSSKDITQFTILGIDGTISGTSISLQVPFGTNLANLTPTITHTGASVSPASGVPHSFTGPTTYTVTAADGSTKPYTVNVTAAPSTSKDITQFTILGVDATISGTSIALTLPFGTSLASLTPTIAHTGASISPPSGVAQSFAAPVMYTVTAADGSTKTYTVVVTVAPSNAKDITQFTINGVDGVITGTSISLTLPFGTNLAILTPTIMHTGQSVSPASGVTQSFTGPRQYTVTAMDGSTKVYTVTVGLALDTSKDITQFTILGVNGTITGTNITLQLPFGTNLTSLTPTITITGVSVSPASGVAQDFSAARQYVVTAADGSTKTYTVNVTAALNSAKDIIAFAILGVDGSIVGTNITVTLPQGTFLNNLTPAIVHTGASINPPGGVAQNFTSPVQYTVTAADGSTKTYTVTVVLGGSSSKNITQFTILGVNGTIGTNTITLQLPFGTPLGNLTPTIVHTGISVSPASGVAHSFVGPATYVVTAADGSSKPYTVTVTTAPSNAKNITSFQILGVNGNIVENPLNPTITVTLPPGTPVTSLTPTIAITGTSVSPANLMAQNFSSSVVYTVTAADGSMKMYTVTVISPQLVSIAVTPPNETIAKGTDQGYTATGKYSDNSTFNITSSVTWSTGDTSIASITAAGLANGEGQGTTSITATVGAISGTTDLTVTMETLVSIAVTPSTKSIAKGTDQPYVATGTYTDGTHQTITGSVSWSTDDMSVATISAAGLAHGVDQGSVTVTATDTASGIFGTATLDVTMAVLVSIEVTPDDDSMPRGTDQPYIATGRYSDNTTQPLTASVDWSSSLTTVATITTAGSVHAVDPGFTEITATDPATGISGSTDLEVTSAALVSIAVTPPDQKIAKGTDLPYKATGTYTDGTTDDITDEVTWDTGDHNVATISNADPTEGRAHGANPGLTEVTATDVATGIVGATDLEVTAAELVSIAVTPPDEQIAKGTDLDYMATGTYTDGTHQDITDDVTWDTDDHSVATISNADPTEGRAHGVAPGFTEVTATLDAITGSTDLEVTAAELVSIAIDPTDPKIAKGTDQDFIATGTYTDGTTQTITDDVTWDSSDDNIASISNADPTEGRAHGKNPGTTEISAALDGIVGTTDLEVTAAALVSIAIDPQDPSIAKGTDLPFTATGTYTDGTTQNLTDDVTWSSSDDDIASISNADPTEGRAHGEDEGTVTITATIGMLSDSTSLEVTAATLASIAVTPPHPSIANGTNQPFVATGTFTDGTVQTLTNAVTWSSSDDNIATISNANPTRGVAHGEDEGTVTITATLNGKSGTALLDVTMATLVSIEVLPINPTMAKGTSVGFTATGTYTDGSTQPLTTTVNWTTTDIAVASVSNASGLQGRVKAEDVGTATIRATLGGIVGESDVNVTMATLQSINVNPATPSIALGTNQQFQALGVYSDLTTLDLTATVTWGSGTQATATISNAAIDKGLATSKAVGTTTITATLGPVMGSTLLTVSAATLVRIDVTPSNPTLPRALTEDFTATAVYSDATTVDLTDVVTWSSSNQAVAIISNANGSEGEALTLIAGTTTITALDPVSMMSGTTLLTVTNGVLQSITVTPNPTTIAIGARVQFTATGNYSDGTSRVITNSVSWSSNASSIAGASNGRKKRGIAVGKKAGMATITATLGAISGSASLTVSNATLQSITITPDNSTIPNKTKQYFQAIGHFSDNSTSDITGAVSWSSTSTSVATISNQNFLEGIATAQSPGLTTIRAQYSEGSITVLGTTPLTVSSATLVSIAVTPGSPVIIAGATQPMTATATYSDNSMKVVTREVTWTSMNPAAATISNAIPTQGLLNGVAAGTSEIRAQYPLTNVFGTANAQILP